LARRSWKTNPFIGLGLVAIAIVAAWLTYRMVKPPRRSIEYAYVLKCDNPNCGNLFVASYPEGQKPPFTCPSCGSLAYPALRCLAKGHIFPLKKDSPSGAPYDCPICGSRGIPLEPGDEAVTEHRTNP
jgi:rRNA maturation endonuclease Nob1